MIFNKKAHDLYRPLNEQSTENCSTLKDKHALLNSFLLQFIITGFLPFVVVENEWFKRFVKTLGTSYNLPCRKTISGGVLNDQYSRVMKIIQAGCTKIFF